MSKVANVADIAFSNSYTDELWTALEQGDTQRLLDTGTRIACQVTPSDSSLILLRLSNMNVSQYASVYRVPQELLAYTVDMSKSIGNYTILQTRPVLIDDYSHHPRKIPLLEGFGYKQVLSVPIMWKGQCFGALNVHTSSHSVYGPEHVQRLTRISQVIAVGLYQQYHLSEQLIWEKTAEVLVKMDRLPVNAQSAEELVAEIHHIFKDFFGTRVAICWRHPGSGTMETASSLPLSTEEQEVFERMNKTTLQRMTLQETPIEMEFSNHDKEGHITFFPMVLAQIALGGIAVFGFTSLPQSTLVAVKILIARVSLLLGSLFLRDDTPGPHQVAKTSDVRRLVEMVSQLISVAPLQRMPLVTEYLKDYFYADAVWIYAQKSGDDGRRFELMALAGNGMKLPSELDFQESIWQNIAETGKLITISHMNGNNVQKTWDPFRQSGLNSLLMISVPIQGQVVLIGVGWILPMAFSAREKSLLQTFILLGRVLFAEYYREHYYREQVSQLLERYHKMASHVEETSAINYYLVTLIKAFQSSDSLSSVLKAIRQMVQANPRLEDGLGQVLYSCDDAQSYLGVSLTSDQWEAVNQSGSVVAGPHLCYRVSFDEQTTILLVVPNYASVSDPEDKIQMAIPIVEQALRQTFEVRWNFQMWRSECLSALGKRGLEDKVFHIRRQLLNIPDSPEYRLGVIFSGALDSTRTLMDVMEVLAQNCHSLRFFLHDNALVFVVPCQDGEKPESVYQLQHVIEEHVILSAMGLRVGISAPVSSLNKFNQAIIEAHRALETSGTDNAEAMLNFYDELNIFSVLVNQTNMPMIKTFIHSFLDPLLDYDRKHQANLILTLKEFLECGGVLQSAASALFLHVNSLKYRLRKIESMLNVSLDDPTLRLQLQMSLKFLEVLDGLDNYSWERSLGE